MQLCSAAAALWLHNHQILFGKERTYVSSVDAFYIDLYISSYSEEMKHEYEGRIPGENISFQI